MLKKEVIDILKEKYDNGEISLEAMIQAGLEPSFSNVVGCKECPFLNKCINMNSEFIEDVEKIEEEYGVTIIGRCPLMMGDL